MQDWEINRRKKFLQETDGSMMVGNAVFSPPIFNENLNLFLWKGTRNWWKWHPYFRGLRIGPFPAMLFIGLFLGILCFIGSPTAVPDINGYPKTYYSPMYLFWGAVFSVPISLYYIYKIMYSKAEISVRDSILKIDRESVDLRGCELHLRVWGKGKNHELPMAGNYPGSASLIIMKDRKEIFVLRIGIDPYRSGHLEQIESALRQIAAAAGIPFIS